MYKRWEEYIAENTYNSTTLLRKIYQNDKTVRNKQQKIIASSKTIFRILQLTLTLVYLSK